MAERLFDRLVDGFLADLAGSGRVSKETLFYRGDPIAYFHDQLGIPSKTLRWSEFPGYQDHRWDGDPDPLARVLEALAAGRNVGVESGTGTGKTFLGAGVVLWFLDCWEPSNVVTLAPKKDQLVQHLWKELGALWPKFKHKHPLARLTTLSVKMRGTVEWSAIGFPVQVRAGEDIAARVQGFHAEHLLFITEETPGIDPPVMLGVENTIIAPHNLHLGLGNPNHQQDSLHVFCKKAEVVHVRVSALDHPNVVLDDANLIPGAVSLKKVVERCQEYGDNSDRYNSRVRGICPTEAKDAVIRWSWLVAAANRKLIDLPEADRVGAPALGVDVANSEAGDEAAIAAGIGPHLLEVISKPCPNANLLGQEVNARLVADHVDEERCGVDGIGVGAGCVNELLRLDKHVISLMSQAAPEAHLGEEIYGNLRAQMWWTFRLDVQHGRLLLPYDVALFQELTTPRRKERQGKLYVEEKVELVKRLRRSPNRADAVVYWNWVRKQRSASTGKCSMVDL